MNLYNVKWKRKYIQDDIVKATKLSKSTVNNLLSGKYHDFKLSSLEKVAKFFECSIHDILIEVEDE